MKEISTRKIFFYNPLTEQHEPVDALRGESAYEAAVRLGYTTLSETEWLRQYAEKLNEAIADIGAERSKAVLAIEAKRAEAENEAQTAIASIEAKGKETLEKIPDEYAALSEQVQKNTDGIAACDNSHIITQTSFNLFDVTKALPGYTNDKGRYIAFPDYSEYVDSNFIPCKGSNRYTIINGVTSTTMIVAFFDANKTFLSSERTMDAIYTPEGACFFRICVSYLGSDYSQCMIIEGDEIPDGFIPYKLVTVIDEDKIDMSKYMGKGTEATPAPEPELNWYAFGDSITAGYGSKEGGGNAYTAYGGYVGLASKMLNFNLVNYAASGSGYTLAGGSGETGLNIIDRADISDADLVTVAYGINDFNRNATLGDENSASMDGSICGNLKYFIETIHTKAPTTALVVILPLNESTKGSKATRYALEKANSKGYTLSDLSNKLISVCDLYGIPYIDWTFHCPCINLQNIQSMLHDGLHPGDRGFEQLAHALVGELRYR